MEDVGENTDKDTIKNRIFIKNKDKRKRAQIIGINKQMNIQLQEN